MQSSYYSFGGIKKDPKEGSANQTAGIGSRWINPEFGQAIGKYSNRPVKDSEPIVSSNPQSPANTSYVGALGRTDSMVKIVERPGDLSKAPRLPNQKLTRSMVSENALMSEYQKRFIMAQRRGDNKAMRSLMNRGSVLTSE